MDNILVIESNQPGQLNTAITPPQEENQDIRSLLDRMQDKGNRTSSLGLEFSDDLARIAISAWTDKGIEVLLVTSAHTATEIRSELAKPYADLVEPRWSKGSLSSYLLGEHIPDPSRTYRQLKATLDGLIDFADDPIASDVVCCWIIGTYVYKMFDAYPYLGVMGPGGSAKTKLADVIKAVSFNPISTDSITTAQLFRSVDVTGGTLILDEQESLATGFSNGDQLAILRGGYKRGGNVLRSREISGDYTTRKFSTYSPKVLINTTGMEDLLAARCIAIHMLRSTGSQGKAIIAGSADQLGFVRDELYCLALENFQAIRQTYHDPDFAPDLNNRQRERWLPILSIANKACPERLADLEAEANKDTGSTFLSDPLDAGFLNVLDGLVDQPTVVLSTQDIGLQMMLALELDYPVRSSKVGRLIRKYLGKVGRRSGKQGGNRYTITRDQVDKLRRLYPPD